MICKKRQILQKKERREVLFYTLGLWRGILANSHNIFNESFSLQTIIMGADLVEMLRDVIFYLGLMSPACFEDLVLGLNFSNVPCIKVPFFSTITFY